MPAPDRPRFRWGRATLLATCLLLVSFVIGELTLRAIHDDDPAALPVAMAPRADQSQATSGDLPVFQNVAQLSAPHVRGLFRGQVHRTDALGFRGPERSARAEPGTRRVIVTGDSIAMGSGVDEADAFPALAEQWLNARGGSTRWEFVNAALAGANLATALDRLEHGIEAYGGDLLVATIVPNDIEGVHYRRFPAKRTALDLINEAGWPARSRSVLIRVATWECLDLWERIQQLNLDHYESELAFNFFENPDAWGTFTLGLDRLARMRDETGSCVIVFLPTRLVDLHPETHPFLPMYEKIARAARARGFHVVQTNAAFFALDASEVSHSQLDPHPNAEGHAVLGRLLAEGIESLPASCFAPPTS